MAKTKVKTKINPYDAQTVKGTLDESIEDYLTRTRGCDINHFQDNTVMLISFVCAVLGALAHYFPRPWPESKPAILAIVVIYYILNSILTYVIPHYYPDVVCISYPDSKGVVFDVRSKMAKYSGNYEYVVNSGNWQVVSIGKYFTKEGLFLKSVFHKDLRTQLEQASKSALSKKKK